MVFTTAAAKAGPGASSANAWRRALELTAPIASDPCRTLPLVIDALAERFGDAPALLSDAACLTYRGLADHARAYARWALEQGTGKGDVVALLLPNCPDYLAIWLGVTRMGGIVALINTNLVGDSLFHSIAVARPRHLIVGAGLADAVAAIRNRLDPAIRCWIHGGKAPGFAALYRAIERGAGCGVDIPEPPSLADSALYIYTSGTTGLPKAARVSHFRLMQWSHWFAGMMDTGPADRIYNCLPMYHSVGGVVATGAALVGGASVVIRDKFSASHFWDDVVRWECTIVQYIGELCRYLVAAPPHPRDTAQRLRLACGNGMRLEVWESFQERSRIPQILEFYAATEGNFALYNCDGKPGAIGRIPPFLAHRFPVALVRFDVDTAEPVRDEAGFCVLCGTDEIGEAIGKIADQVVSPGGRFEGYTDAAASRRKILRDVFAPGDAWYRTGDLMRKDRAGFFYFVDRVGDTFRWKGENVSSVEVAEAVVAAPGVIEAVVYGVAVPGMDGRAGMAAIVADDGFNLRRFGAHLAERLPDYARPVFLRLRDAIDVTGTFKPQKQALAREGCDPALIADPLYVNDRENSAYVALDAALYRRICAGGFRL